MKTIVGSRVVTGIICWLVFLAVLNVVPLFAVNAPVITHIMGKAVVAGTTQYANVDTGLQIRGNAEVGTTIRLFRNSNLVGDTLTDGTGVWIITFNTSQGKADYDADANDGTFTSARCPSVEIHVDTAPPYGYVCNGSYWYSKFVRAYAFNPEYYFHTVYETNSTSGSGLDFSTASMTIIDITTNTNIPVSLQHDNDSKVFFTPLPDDSALKIDDHEYLITFEMSDKAGNVAVGSKTIYCDFTNPVTIIEKIYDPDHDVITGTNEPNPNVPDADGYVDYYPYMTINYQPTRIRGVTENPCYSHEGSGTYRIRVYYSEESSLYLDNGIDSVGNFTAHISSKFYTGNTSIDVDTYDSAGNYTYQYARLKFVNPCPDPVILKVYDPAHHIFTGTGETLANVPDVDGYVDYFPNIKISTQPTTLIGTIDPGNMSYFQLQNNIFGSKYYYVGAEIDAVTGSFTVTLDADFWNGSHYFYWYIYNDSGSYQSRSAYLYFIDNKEPPPNSISSLNYARYGYHKLTVDSQIVPTMIGSASIYAYPQVIWLKGNAAGTFKTDYQYATVVLPSGQTYPNVAGAYDIGDVWNDLDQDGQWSVGEPYVDMPARGLSDGRSFSIPNFLEIKAPDNMSTQYLFYAYSRGPDYDSSSYGGCYWFSDWTRPHLIQDFSLLPSLDHPFRNTTSKPTSVTVDCRKSSYYSYASVYGLKQAESTISIVNALDAVALAPVASWTYIGNPEWHKSYIDLTSETFAEGTYRVKVYLKNEMNVVSNDESNYFLIDNTSPLAQDFAPAEGAVSNSFTSFNARIVDSYLGDNSPGSGANMDVALSQIWPFKLLTNQFYVANNVDTITFTLADGEAYAKNHVGQILADGAVIEVWRVVSGQYQNVTIPIIVMSNAGNGTLTVKTFSGSNFPQNSDYVALFAIPCFTSNNGVDRVGAVPITPVTEDGQYVCRVLTLDNSLNSGVFFAPYSRLELAAGPITLTTDRIFLFMGLVPPDVATFTSNTIRTRKNNIVQDNQAVTVQRDPESLTVFTLPDANGLPGDGYQVYTGTHGATPGLGMFVYGVEVTGSIPDVLNTVCAIGLASGSSSPIPIVQVEAFMLVPATTTPAITPANPNGATLVSSTLVGYTGVPVPDGSMATWTITAHQLENPTGSMYSMSGYSTSYWYPDRMSDGYTGSYAHYFYSPSYSTPVPGANFTIDLGVGNEKEWVRLDAYTRSSSLDLMFDIEYSDDGISWVTAQSNFVPTGYYSWTRTDWGYYGKHRFWRMIQTNTPTYYSSYLCELSWYTNPARPNITPDCSPLPGIQSAIQNGFANVFVSAERKGPVTFKMIVAGRSASCVIDFIDRYPPDPPASMTVIPQYSQGSAQIYWTESVDHGGAGTQDYYVEQSLDAGSFSQVLTIATTTAVISDLVDGDYLFRIVARDADGNIGNPSVATYCIVDTVPPPPIDCSDIGPGNMDPDEMFSVDPNIWFYFNPTDDRSGPAEVNVQIATASDFSLLVHDVWIPAATSYQFTEAQSSYIHYARVRVKDRSGNIGTFGTPSNGIHVHYSGATTPPNAPIISAIDGKPAIPGTPIATNKTTGVAVVGMSESSNLVEIWLNGSYVRSVISALDGNYTHTLDLPAGTHKIKTRSHNGFSQSPFSTEFQIIVDTTPPALDLRIYITGNNLVTRNWVARQGNNHNIEYINLVVSDSGGAGFDINVASITIIDIDDTGIPLPDTTSYPNPLQGNATAISADTSQYVPTAGWPAALQDQHKYRIHYECTDLAGNRTYLTRDIAIDNLRPGEAAGVPADTAPPQNNFREIFLYNLETYPSGQPPASALIPLVWSDTDSAYIVDPAFNDPILVDNSTSPVALLFNTPGLYGHVWKAGSYNPPPQTNLDTLAYSTGIAWGWGGNINLTASPLGHSNWFRYGYRTIVNGHHSFTLYIQDSAICRDMPVVKLNILSPTPAPHPPVSARFYDATNPALEFPTIVSSSLFAIPGNWMYALDTVITNNSNPLMVKVQVPITSFDQTVEANYGSTIYASATVPAGSDMAVLLLSMTGSEYRRKFQIRTRANGYLSMNLPRESVGWYFGYVRDDVTQPVGYDLIPLERNYNALSGASARPFPTRFSLKAKDTTNGTNVSWINISASTVRLQNSAATQLAGILTREYDAPATAYGFRYDLSAPPTTEGTYYYYAQLIDGAQPAANSFVASFAFRLDKTSPVPENVSPGDGTITNSLPSFSCQSVDPLLADGTEGSGSNVDPTLAQVVPYKELGRKTPVDGANIEVTISGIDTTATDHVDQVLTVGTAVVFAKVSGSALEVPARFGTIASNGSDKLAAIRTSGPAFILSETYAVLWAIPTFQSNDGVDNLAAVPIQPAVKGGSYVAYFTLTDKSLNQGTYTSASSIYEAAYGPFTLTADRTSLYAGLFPPHAANYVSGQILTTEANPVQPGTQVTVFTQPQLGSFGPADANGIPGDGHQVVCDANGMLHFQLLASGTALGLAKVKAVIGLANGSDSSVIFVQLPAYSVNITQPTLTITPLNLNPSTTITAGTFGNAGDLVPNGTMLNASSTLGSFSPTDAVATWPGHQLPITDGNTSFSFSSGKAGTAYISFECGGVVVNKTITVIDKAPPTAPGVPDISPMLSGTGNLLITWGAATDPGDSGISSYQLQYSFNGGIWTDVAVVSLPIYNTVGLAHGLYKFRARAVDGAGNIGPYGNESLQVEVDRLPPFGTITVNGGASRTATTSVTLTLTAADANGVSGMSFSNDSINWSLWQSMASTFAWSLTTGDGNKIVYARFQDSLGNISVPQQGGIILDTTPPGGTVSIIESPYTATHTIHLALNAVDGAGVSLMSIQNSGQASVSVAYASSYIWDLAPGNGTRTVLISFVDSLGNRSASATVSTVVDNAKPVVTDVEDDGLYSPFIDKLHATWSATDADSGLDHIIVRVGTATGASNVVADTNVGLATETTFTGLTLDLTGATQYYFTVWAYDKIGNMSLPGYSDGIKGGDPTPPEPFFITVEDNYTADKTKLSASWTASQDPDSGINRYEFSAGTASGSADVVTWTSVGLALNYSATGLNLTHGQTYYINVRVYNNGGTYTPSYSEGIVVDLLAPPVPIMAAEPAYSSGTANLVSCSAVVDTVSGGVTYDFQRATDTGFSAGLMSSGWQTANGYNFIGLTHGTTYYFRVRAQDQLGNVSSYSAAVSSIQDSNPPTATNYTDDIPLNNDPDHLWSRDANVSFAATSLSDDLSGVKNVYVQISDSAAFATILTESWLGNTTGAYTYTAPAVDSSTIYARAKFKDVAGNISNWSSACTTDGISIDLTRPLAGPTVASNDDPNIKFEFSHSDSVSGVADVYIQIAHNSEFTDIAKELWLGGAVNSYLFTEVVDGFTYYAKIKTKDKAGWESSDYGAPSAGINVDMSPPVPYPDPDGQAFYINRRAGENYGDTTTATSTVYISITVSDPSGVRYAYISNDNLDWTTWLNPAYSDPPVLPVPSTATVWDPASISWSLTATSGLKNVYMEFEDGVGNRGTPSLQTIEYYPFFNVASGTRDEGVYPVDTYDEYLGQNKYGVDRSESQDANRGSSLKLVTP